MAESMNLKRHAASRKDGSRKKAATAQKGVLVGVGVLVLLPSTFVVKEGLSVPLSCHADMHDLVTTRNQDFCMTFLNTQGREHDLSQKLVPYSPHNFSEKDPHVVFPSAHMIVFFLADALLKDHVGDGYMPWLFTRTKTFGLCYEANKEEFRSWLRECGIKLIILGPCNEWETPDRTEKGKEVIDFCYSLVNEDICVYPPIRCCNLFLDKDRRRSMFESLMLPSALVPMSAAFGNWTDLVESASQINQFATSGQKAVVKTTLGGSCNGVHVVERVGAEWQEVDNVDLADLHYEVGIKFIVEPYMTAFEPSGDGIGGEERMMVHLPNQSKTATLYCVQATSNPCGAKRGVLDILPVTDGPRAITPGSASESIRRRFGHLLHNTHPTSCMNLKDLIFRLDMIKVDSEDELRAIGVDPNEHNGVFVNEIDVFPIAYDMIDSWLPGQVYIKKMAQAVADFIKVNWPNGWQV